MSILIESPTERFLPDPHFIPFPKEYWYNGFFDDIHDPEIDGMPVPPMAFRGNPILLAGKPGGVFHERKEEIFLNYDFTPLNPYRERLTDREDWALIEAERIWHDIHNITSVFELKSSCCPDSVQAFFISVRFWMVSYHSLSAIISDRKPLNPRIQCHANHRQRSKRTRIPRAFQ